MFCERVNTVVKLKDIAKHCNVSIATVSKALNYSADISKDTVTWINQVAKEMGYVPSATARALKTNRSYNIAILFEDKSHSGLSHEYFSTILGSLQEEAGMLGYDITFLGSGIGRFKSSYLEHARYRNCDGIVIASADFRSPEVVALVESEIPTVTIDYVFNNRTAILSNNVQGMIDIVNYLYENGHHRIAFIHGEDTAVTQKRLASFFTACEKLGIEHRPEYIKSAMYHIPKYSGIATRELLSLPEPPTCIIYPDDYSYLGGMTEIEKHGLKIPDDISVVGYDGIYLSTILRPVLTTYVQDSLMIGKLAASKLIYMIENPRTFIPEQVIVSGRLQEGQTVKKISVSK